MGEVSGAWRNIPGSGFEVRATDCEFGDSLLIRCYSLFFCATADAAFALSVCRQVVCSDLSVARNESRKKFAVKFADKFAVPETTAKFVLAAARKIDTRLGSPARPPCLRIAC